MVGDFWAWAYGDLLSNTTRPILAEFLVGQALGCLEPGATRVEWDAWDLTWQGHGIEVKSAGRLQTWHKPSDGPSPIKFDIAPRIAEPGRPASVYVFCVHAASERATADPLDTTQWDFYVVGTSTIERELADQKTMTLSILRNRLGAEIVQWGQLRTAVAEVLPPPA